MKKIIIGSRGSKLALMYAQKAKDEIIQNSNFNDQDIVIKEIITKGDQVHDTRISEIGGKGLFSKNIENEHIKPSKARLYLRTLCTFMIFAFPSI